MKCSRFALFALMALESLLAQGVQPLTVAGHADTARAAKQTILTTGGVLTATSADGTVFTLTLPKDALLSDQEITMTPLAYIDSLPLSGGFVAGVQLEPEGLRLYSPATLTIALPNPIQPQFETSFAYHGAGESFHLYPLEIDPRQISFNLLHFSGYGLGSGTADDRAALNARPPAPRRRCDGAKPADRPQRRAPHSTRGIGR